MPACRVVCRGGRTARASHTSHNCSGRTAHRSAVSLLDATILCMHVALTCTRLACLHPAVPCVGSWFHCLTLSLHTRRVATPTLCLQPASPPWVVSPFPAQPRRLHVCPCQQRQTTPAKSHCECRTRAASTTLPAACTTLPVPPPCWCTTMPGDDGTAACCLPAQLPACRPA